MPPVRTMPPVKHAKTERTHAENQERAYIAASRRSDRSLEARVESARRASEIHKKRTGRSLRVTEADVINEEMYEEEDDDLPAQIRRITAHLHTGNDPFNRRLQSYLANHIAMRSALGQVVAENWHQQQRQNDTINQYLNPTLMQQYQQQQRQQQQQQSPFALSSTMLPPQSPALRSPSTFRTSPYPIVNGMPSASASSTPHARSASIATPYELHHQQPMTPSQHTMSGNASPEENNHPDRRFSFSHAPPSNSMSTSQSFVDNQTSQQSTSPHMTRDALPADQQQQRRRSSTTAPLHLNLSHPMFTSPFGLVSDLNMGPLSATLPLETQQLLAGAPASEFQDPAMAAMMQSHLVPTPNGSFKPAPSFYSYNPNGSKSKSKSTTPTNGTLTSSTGMNATLAPSMLDSKPPSSFAAVENPVAFAFDNAAPSADKMCMPSADTAATSGQTTPGEADWNMWIESQALGDDPVTS